MNVGSWLVWGLAATVVLTAIMAGTQGAGLSRMSIPYMLGTMVTPNRDRAVPVGTALHLLIGWAFSLVYVAAFHAWGDATWWRGALIGLVHAGFVLTAGMQGIAGLHPRMASEEEGPDLVRQLEPPGFLALHYGGATPITVLVAHLVFGGVLGAFYQP
ncbi:MAG TPA: hypothetical protein VKZ63_10085 [Kofleriaceae bacterium]|nr:hypothetical protein [Kofleriaceae bacterium]